MNNMSIAIVNQSAYCYKNHFDLTDKKIYFVYITKKLLKKKDISHSTKYKITKKKKQLARNRVSVTHGVILSFD